MGDEEDLRLVQGMPAAELAGRVTQGTFAEKWDLWNGFTEEVREALREQRVLSAQQDLIQFLAKAREAARNGSELIVMEWRTKRPRDDMHDLLHEAPGAGFGLKKKKNKALGTHVLEVDLEGE